MVAGEITPDTYQDVKRLQLIMPAFFTKFSRSLVANYFLAGRLEGF